MVGAEEDPRVAAVGPLPGRASAGPVPIVAETRRHDVHRTVGADPRKDADSTVLASDRDQRLPEQVEVEEVAGLGIWETWATHCQPLRRRWATSQSKNSSLV
jgi:hypothetical protein